MVGNVIAQQIGNRAFFMLGAKNLTTDGKGLTFKVGRKAKGVTHVRVELTPADTYTVNFSKCRAGKVTTLASVDDVYVDRLHSVIEDHTGMYTSL
jgi:hypothetical protein